MNHRRRAARRTDRGAVIPITAMALVPLMIIAAFAVDLGAWYAQTSRIQRAADAAALAGVVWMPDFPTARAVALDAAERNGYDDADPDVVVTVATPGARQLTVSIRADGQQFLSQMAVDAPELERDGTAEYVLAVPLGSRDNAVGNQGYADTDRLWASISGPYTARVNGDPYSTKCDASTSNTTCTTTNPEYRDTGYVYAIDVLPSMVNKTLTVDIFDAGHYARADYANVETADNGRVNVEYELFRADNTPLDISDNLSSANSLAGSCNSGPGRQYIGYEDTSNPNWRSNWFTLCQVTANVAGQWFLRVKSSGISGVSDYGNGWNQFTVRARMNTGPHPALFGVNDLSLFNNLPGQSGTFSATFDLARVDPVHRGKGMRISLFDPGDGQSGTYDVNILRPGGATTSCTYGPRGGSTSTSSACSIVTRNSSGNTYNGQWLDIDVNIPSTYACTTDCWWRVRYDFASVNAGQSPNDRTVWSATIVGDPVHLIE